MKAASRAAVALLAGAALAATAAPSAGVQDAPERGLAPRTATAAAAREGLDRALAWLRGEQRPDGSFGLPVPDHPGEIGFAWPSYYAWHFASSALACMALRAAPETPERRAALERGLAWLAATRVPERGDAWDVDSNWALLYGFVCVVEAIGDPRFAEHELRPALEARGRLLWARLAERQTPDGGWAYYDDPPYTARPTWATSFCTALVLPAMRTAREDLGWSVAADALAAARGLLERCALPNGAFAYDHRPVPRAFGGESIDAVKGSLGRIQVGHWALLELGSEVRDLDDVRRGLEQLFEHHRFLDLARMRPIPHEGWYANAGYFYFFAHYYAALAIELLPADEREAWHARLRPELLKTLAPDGSTNDFLGATWSVNASTAYAALALALGLPDERD